MSGKKKKTNRELTAQELIGVEAIQGNILWTQDKHLFAFIQCRGADNSLLTEAAHAAVTENLTQALSDQTEPWQLLSIPRTVDTEGMLEKLRQLRKETHNDTRLRLLTGEINALEELAEDGAKEPLLILKIWVSAARNADHALLDRAATICSKLQDQHVAATLLNDDQILRLCCIYAELGVWQESITQNDIPTLTGRKRLFSRKSSPEAQAHAAMMEQITPVGGMQFSATSAWIGSSLCKFYGAIRYPAEVDYGWLVKIMGATDCITCITYYASMASEIGDALSRSMRTSSQIALEENDARQRKRYERKVMDADRLIDNLDAKGMSLGHISIVTMPYAQDKEELERVCRRVRDRFSLKRVKLKELACVQKEAWKHISPYYTNQQTIDDMLKRIIPLETVMGGYPMTVNILRDDNGVYFGRTPDRGIVSLDIYHRSTDRNNGHGIVTGIPGIGKSTLLKSLIESIYMLGVKVIINDPEREFREMCQAMGGTWINAGGGSARVNLLQLQALASDPKDDEEEVFKDKKQSLLSFHVQHILTILRYKFRDLTDTDMSLLERTLLELYAQYGITLDSDESCLLRDNSEYPIMEDFWNLLKKHIPEDARFADLALLLESMAVGADSRIWNGHTNIDLSNNLIVIDTHALNEGSEQNKVAQYFNLLRMEFTAASLHRDERYFIVCDESQTMFDPNLPQAAMALKNMALRLRKYEGCLWLAFHSLQEFLDDKVRLAGQPILDSATYKILFGTDGQNLADTVSLFKLTASEEKFLESKQRGKALCLIGNRHMRIDFELPQYRLELMGTGGGR